MIKQHFINGRMNLDSDERLLPKGDHRKAVNIRVSNSEGGDVGAIENILGNELASIGLDIGNNAITVGADRSIGLNRIFWLVKSDLGSFFFEYDISTGVSSTILRDTREGDDNVLDLSVDHHVERIVIIEDYDNGQTLALWSDGRKPIRCVNIDRAKTYGANNFTDESINLIKRPPTTKPSISLEKSLNGAENNIEEKFIRFAYSYEYLDGEYSALSSFTSIGFLGLPFQYDFSINSNESMVNTFNKVVLSLNTGNELVKGLRVVFKESNSNTPYIIDTFNKNDKGWGHNEIVEVEFSNNKITSVLPQDELFRLYDAVPRLANTIEIIDNTIAVSDYTENYNLVDVEGNKVVIDLKLDSVENIIPRGVATTSIKTIRDYEAGIVYLDEDGRMTSVLVSDQNTVNIPGSKSDVKNLLRLAINHRAPAFAKAYRVFIKQSKYEYDTIVPSLFYNDGLFVWVKLENGERDKISEGQYLIVKSDTTGLIERYEETRVIEIVDQEENFLREGDDDSSRQLSGTYFKLKPENIRLNEDDFDMYEFEGYDSTRASYSNPIREESNVIEPAVYYGTSGLNDLEELGTYIGEKDIRYIVEIDTVGPTDTFIWSDDNGESFSAPTQITGNTQNLSNGVMVVFSSTTGHSNDDNWIISAKSVDATVVSNGTVINQGNGFGIEERSRTYAMFKSISSNGNINIDDVIEGGARITIKYDEYGAGNTFIEKDYISSRQYANLEEWWFRDNIEDDFDFPIRENIYFRRGRVENDDNAKKFIQDPNGDMVLIIKSIARQGNGISARVRTSSRISITQSSFNILLETKSNIINSDTFFEIGDTYPITAEGWHQRLNQNDISQTPNTNATLILDFWNCISWGNGFESYKIKDDFNGNALNIDTRPNTFINEYRENYRRAGIILGGRYEQTTNYNAINEFNYSLGQFIDLDDANGACRYLYAKGKTLIAFQENRITPLGYRKNFFYDQQGGATFTASDDILTIPDSYTGEYGISDNPESFSFFGNRIYFVDRRRGTPARLSTDGISEINILTKDFFKDLFRDYPNARYESGYDPYFDEYLLVVTDCKEKFTIGFSENGYSQENKGWSSFYQFVPEKLLGINNRLYSFKEGSLWLHNSENVPRNNFYGVQYTSKITTVFNDDALNDKIFKTLAISGNKPWEVKARTNLNESTIEEKEFVSKESKYYAYLRQNENTDNLNGGAVQGVGNLISHDGLVLTFNKVPEVVSIGNRLYQVVNDQRELLGEISSFTDTTITLASINITPIDGSFCFNLKNSRVESANIRGYFLEVELENTDTDFVELFAVESNMVASDLHSN